MWDKANPQNHKGAQRHNGRNGSTQIHPRRHLPITGPSPQAQRSTGMHKYRWEHNPRNTKHKNPIWTPLRIVPAQPQPHRLSVKPITRGQSEAIWKSLFRLIGLLSRRNSVGHKGIAIPGHRIYYRIFRGEKRWQKTEV